MPIGDHFYSYAVTSIKCQVFVFGVIGSEIWLGYGMISFLNGSESVLCKDAITAL